MIICFFCSYNVRFTILLPYAETKLAQRQLSAGHVLFDFEGLEVGGEDGIGEFR